MSWFLAAICLLVAATADDTDLSWRALAFAGVFAVLHLARMVEKSNERPRT